MPARIGAEVAPSCVMAHVAISATSATPPAIGQIIQRRWGAEVGIVMTLIGAGQSILPALRRIVLLRRRPTIKRTADLAGLRIHPQRARISEESQDFNL